MAEIEAKSATKFALRGGKLKSLGSKVLAGVRQHGQSAVWAAPARLLHLSRARLVAWAARNS
tara:strand:+ start:331 stop:516 length:186 start_codon:yes stop_codon:yes gene_type:complete